MKFYVEARDVLSLKGDLLVVNMHDGEINKGTFLEAVDRKLKGEIRELIRREEFKGTSGTSKLVYTRGRLGVNYLLILGLGDEKKYSIDHARKCGATLRAVADQIKAKTVLSAAHGGHLKNQDKPSCAQAVVEGIILSAYKYSRYLKNNNGSKIASVGILCPDPKVRKKVGEAIKQAELITRGVYLARDLVNTPALDMPPNELARQAKKIKGVRVKVHNLSQIKKLKMGAFLGVAAGSTVNPPCFIEMHYKPKRKPKKKIAIIGKGVTFDSGGLSIKPAKSMETMKDDMSGAAAVIGLMSIIKDLAPDVSVSGYIAATENMVDGHSIRPGDILTAMDGTTIEVLNTDAEGRLTLADAMTYALRAKPDIMIDMATLTGACLVALGLQYSAILGNDKDLLTDLIAAGNVAGEKIWELPLVDEYRDQIKSPIADIKNTGGSYAGTITAALFLERFVGKTKWAHLDIAGPAWTDAPLPLDPRGGTGVMVRTLARYLGKH